MSTYIKDIQVNNNSVTAIRSTNGVISWMSSIISEIEESAGVVIITKVNGDVIRIPIKQGLSAGEVDKMLESYYDRDEINNMVHKINLKFDKYITDERLRRIVGISKNSCGCGEETSDCGCDSGFGVTCENFVYSIEDNRLTCEGIVITDTYGNEINILETLHVEDINQVSTGTYRVTKCDETFDIVTGDRVSNNNNGTYTVNPGDDRGNFTITSGDVVKNNGNGSYTVTPGNGDSSFTIKQTSVKDNGNGTYTFCNYDGSPCFTIDTNIVNTISKYIVYNNIGKRAWYPLRSDEGGKLANAIPVPGYGLYEFQNIDVIWGDVINDTVIQTQMQQNQFNHNGTFASSGTSDLYTDNVGSFHTATGTSFSYVYSITNDYKIVGGTTSGNISDDIGLMAVTVSIGVPIVDLTRTADMYDAMTYKQRALMTKTADQEVNDVYDIWSKTVESDYVNHLEASKLLTAYLNPEPEQNYTELRTKMSALVSKIGGGVNE